MTTNEMNEYINLALEGEDSIIKRKEILKQKQQELEKKITIIQKSLDHISEKQHFYADVLDGKIEYFSLLLNNENE